MSKADRAKKQRAAKAAWKEAQLAEMPPPPSAKREQQPRVRGRFSADPEPAKVALDKRARDLGIEPDHKGRQAVRPPWLGSDVGRCIAEAHEAKPAQITRLWGVWQAWCAAERNYLLRHSGMTGEPKGMAFEMIPDRVETDTRHSVDTRTAEERFTAAVDAWMRWQGLIGKLESSEQVRVHAARRSEGRPLWRNGASTVEGRRVVAAIERLAGFAEGA